MNVSFKIRDVQKVKNYLKTVGSGLLRVALYAFTEYVIGNDQHGLRHSEPYKYVSRADAYGKVSDAPAGYFSWEQFRYVMARLHDGSMKIGNNRTGASADGWQYTETGSKGYGVTITNPEPSAYWTRDDSGQARQPALVGWRKVSKVISDNMVGAIRHANSKVSEYLKKQK